MADANYDMTSGVAPYLTIKGASDAIEFYKKAFNAKELARMPGEDGKRLMHAAISINNAPILMSDDFPEYCGGQSSAPTAEGPASVSISLHFKTPQEVDETFRRAIAAGATSQTEPADMFWNARWAQLVDPFNHRWMLNAPLPQK